MLSVIIPTRNRADLLRLALLSLQTQTLPSDQFEVLVVDNGSTDDTSLIVLSQQKTFGNLHYILAPNPGLHVGRHRGMLEALGDILVFADDDIEATPNWLAVIAECFSNQDVALVGGNNLPKFESQPPNWLLQLWRRPFLDGHAIPALSILELPEGQREINPHFIWGCNFAIRYSVLKDSGGFHPDGMPREMLKYRGDGETHVSNYIYTSGLKALFDSRASVYHLVSNERMTKGYFYRRHFAQGISDSYSDIRAARAIPGPTKCMILLARVLRNRLNYILKTIITQDSVEREINKILSNSKYHHFRGYRFHLLKVQKDHELLKWVLKENYW